MEAVPREVPAWLCWIVIPLVSIAFGACIWTLFGIVTRWGDKDPWPWPWKTKRPSKKD